MKKLLCFKHKWENVGRDYVPRRPESASFKFGGGLWGEGADQALAMVQDAMYGYTIISQCCMECGKVQTVKLRGCFNP